MEISTVLAKMAMLVLLMLVGYLCAKLHITGPEFNKRVNPIVLNVLLTATILNSVVNAETTLSGTVILEYVGVTTLMLLILHAVSFFVPKLLRSRGGDVGVLRMVMSYPNNAFVGFPVVQAVFGTEAVFYASLSNIPFNTMLYTVGTAILRGSGEKQKFNWRQLLTMPLIATFLAVVLFLTHLHVPAVIADTISTLSAATTPMSMIVIGTSLGGIPLKKAFGNWRVYVASFVRLIVCPVVVWAVLRLFVHDEGVARAHVALQDRPGDERLRLALQIPLERPRTVDGVEPVLNDVRLGRVGQLQRKRPVGQTAAQARNKVVDDLREVLFRQRAEEDDLVEPNARRSSAFTPALASSVMLPAASMPSSRYWLPRFDVRMMIVFLKSTVRP